MQPARGGVFCRRERVLDRRHCRYPVYHSPRCGRPGVVLSLKRTEFGWPSLPILGYMPPNVKMAITEIVTFLCSKVNHDLEMLRDGPYPWSVKQRVMSRVGHLSNEAASDFLEKNYDGNASYVVLAHLSESNNLPELARVTAERALADRMSLLANKLILAQQDAPLEPYLLISGRVKIEVPPEILFSCTYIRRRLLRFEY